MTIEKPEPDCYKINEIKDEHKNSCSFKSGMNEILDFNFEDGLLSNSFLDQINPDEKRESYKASSSLSFMK